MAWPKEILPLRRARISPVRFSDLTTWTGTGSLDTYSSNLRPRCSAEGKKNTTWNVRCITEKHIYIAGTNVCNKLHTKDKDSTTLMIRCIDKRYNAYFCDLYCLVHISLHFSSLISSEAMRATKMSYNTCCFHVCTRCIRELLPDNGEVWQTLYQRASSDNGEVWQMLY